MSFKATSVAEDGLLVERRFWIAVCLADFTPTPRITECQLTFFWLISVGKELMFGREGTDIDASMIAAI